VENILFSIAHERSNTLPAWADWGLMGGFSGQSELEVLRNN